MAVVVGPVVVPFLLRGPHAFVENVILFPLGLSGVASPAASPMPGHLLVAAFPSLHRILPVTVAVVGGAVLVAHLVRSPPRTASAVCVARRVGDDRGHPVRPGHPDRLPALPDQLLRVGPAAWAGPRGRAVG